MSEHLWLYSEEDMANTPSRRDNVDVPTEKRYRREGAKLIFDVGVALSL